MKQIATIIFSLLCTLSAQGQLTRSWQDAPFRQVIADITKASDDYHIHCIYDRLDSLRISAKVSNATVPDAIARITKGLPVKVKTKGQDIFIQYDSRQARRKIELKGLVKDWQTHNDLVGATVKLLRRDSTLAGQSVADKKTIYGATVSAGEITGGEEVHTAEFSMEIPPTPEQYILAVSYIGYQTAYVNYTVNNIRKSEMTRTLPPIYLKQDRHVLKEVDVVASKVMFYYRGDTIVYNADAFLLAEGSMLDALVKQLPGVELRKNGQIYHNGQFVKNLLLNGKDFFKGNNEVLLDNLPSYTVKEIKVYDKYGEKSEFLGTQLENDKEYVMDVRLKREYNIGWQANVEAGTGTADRYLARLLAIRFSDHSRIALYGNMNNLNDNRKPGENDDWKPTDMKTGLQAERLAGIDYNVEERDKQWTAKGNVQLSYTDLDRMTTTERTNFLTTGDTRDHAWEAQRQKTFKLSTNHKWVANLGSVLLTMLPEFSYQHYDFREELASRTLASTDTLINQLLRQGKTKGYEREGKIDLWGTIKLRDAKEHLGFSLSLSQDSKDDDRFSRYAIDYAAGSQYSDLYQKNHPDQQRKGTLDLSYTRQLSNKLFTQLVYFYTHTQQIRRQAFYQLDLLDSVADNPIGVLPSEALYAQTLDAANSFDSHSYNNIHELRPYFSWEHRLGQGKFIIQSHISGVSMSQRLNYQRGVMDTTLTRHTAYFQLPMAGISWYDDKGVYRIWSMFHSFVKMPELTNLVSIHDTTDPMNIYEGNTDLKGRRSYTAELAVSKTLREKQVSQTIRAYYNYYRNSLAMGYTYNPQTGVRIWRPYNVSGNQYAELSYRLSLPLDKKRRLMLSSTTEGAYDHNVDMVAAGTTAATAPVRSVVVEKSVEEDLKLTWKLGSHQLALKADGLWRFVDSSREGFISYHACELNYGATALLSLPLKLQLSTDFTVYTRHGFLASDLNGTELVWNARLSRPFCKGRLLLVLDGYDLFGQLSNVTRSINGLRRQEAYTNTLPRYALLHFVWRLNKNRHKPSLR